MQCQSQSHREQCQADSVKSTPFVVALTPEAALANGAEVTGSVARVIVLYNLLGHYTRVGTTPLELRKSPARLRYDNIPCVKRE